MLPLASSDNTTNTDGTQASEALVDLDQVVTDDYLGVGIQWSAYPWFELTEAEWRRVFRRLRFMRPAITRIMQSAFFYWKGIDHSGESVYDFSSQYLQKLRALLDWCELNGTSVILGEWGAPTSCDGGALDNDDERWPRMIADFLTDLFERNDYQCIRYFNLINEPHGSWSSIAGRFDEWKRAILSLNQTLIQTGLRKRIAIVAPDADQLWTRRTLADPQLRAVTDLYDEHRYVTRDALYAGQVERWCREQCEMVARLDAGKPFILGELGIEDGKTNDDRQPNVFGFDYGVDMADAAVQLMRGGCSGFIAWYLDDAMHFLGDGDVGRPEARPLPEEAYRRRKVWGMWNSLAERMGDPEESKLRPWFYPWSLLSRNFPAGCQILSVDVDGPASLAIAAARIAGDEHTDLSLAIVSRDTSAQAVRVRVPALRRPLQLARFDYFDSDGDGRPDSWPVTVDKSGNDIFPTPTAYLRDVDLQEGMIIELCGRGLTILTSLDTERGMTA